MKYNGVLTKLIVPYKTKYPSKYWDVFASFLTIYEGIINKKNLDINYYILTFNVYIKLICKHLKTPFKFKPFHKAIRKPIDCYELGLNIFRPLIDIKNSTLNGIENIKKIEQYINANENVILFSNHQIEADPQVISILLGDMFKKLSEDMIFVAGSRVTTDAIAAPISLGRNLFCIYSRKYFKILEHKKTEMVNHNKKTIMTISKHLNEGGKCIYIAPSGGRDRANKNKKIEVAKFDPQSIELFYILGKKSKQPTHFFPLSLSTYNLLPPPTENINSKLGEIRYTNESPAHMSFGDELNMEELTNNDNQNKSEKKDARANCIWEIVKDMYEKFPN